MTDFKIKMAELAKKYHISHQRDIEWHNFVAEVEQLTHPELKESEDERIIKFLKHAATLDAADELFQEYGVKHTQVIAWLERQKEQKPIEWSEEDEKKINFLSRLIEFQVKDDEYCFGDGRLISKQEAIEMLKSLRPVSKDSLQSWKPSEAHLSALLAVFNDPNNIGSQTCQLALTDLYEQLNKL